jgi:hypothetical protein
LCCLESKFAFRQRDVSSVRRCDTRLVFFPQPDGDSDSQVGRLRRMFWQNGVGIAQRRFRGSAARARFGIR